MQNAWVRPGVLLRFDSTASTFTCRPAVATRSMNMITSLAPNEVFVFGSNSTGFHGAGAAGYACRGTARNTWRDDPWFTAARLSPVGSPQRIGRWAIYGVARGFQRGREGASYAIETIRKPGALRSVPLSEIEEQLVELCRYAEAHPELRFLMTAIGANFAGYTGMEMQACLDAALRRGGCPANLIVPPDLYR